MRSGLKKRLDIIKKMYKARKGNKCSEKVDQNWRQVEVKQ